MSHFRDEIWQQPEVLRAVLGDAGPVEVAAGLGRRRFDVVMTLARGSSDNAVTFYSYLAGRHLGLPVASLPPSLFSVYRAVMRAERALVVAVSQSGESSDVIEGVRSLKEHGALSLAVTNHVDSTLARVADHALDLHAGEERAVAASKTFSSQMMVLACLVAHWSQDADLRAALEQVPERMAALLAAPDAIRQAAERLTHAEGIYVLGRGLSYAPALETALKLKETAYLHAQAYSSAEFQHGPIASVDPTDPVLLLAGSDATEESNLAVVGRLREIGADVMVLSGSERLRAAVKTGIALPAGLHPVCEAFLLVLAGQLLALFLTESKGLDPDRPRYLDKVTRTL